MKKHIKKIRRRRKVEATTGAFKMERKMFEMDKRRYAIKPGGIIDRILVVVIYILLVLFIWVVITGPSYENMPYGDEEYLLVPR